MPPLVSILIPCRNDEVYIGRCLDAILASDYPGHRLEILVVDGGSTDGTRPILVRYAALHPSIVLLDSPSGTTPAGLNLAIRSASGDFVVRMDARVLYPPDYIPLLVAALQEAGVDNVGGVMEMIPGDESPIARAIAVGLAHPFGAGESTAARERRAVHTVPLGCCRHQIFDRIGMFDEELTRHYDEEFNVRAMSNGGRVLLIPEARCRYLAPWSIHELARMHYEGGYFKPLVARKVGQVMTIRQSIPALLVGSMSSTAALAPWLPAARYIFALLAGFYALLVVLFAAGVVRSHGFRCAAALLVIFPVLHFSYGGGLLRGIRDHLVAYTAPRPFALHLCR